MNRHYLSIAGFTLVLLLLMQQVNAQYCLPTSSCTFPDIITNVTFAGINRTSACDAPNATPNGYSSYTTPSATVIQLQSYPISVTTGGDLEGITVWIDYNHDFVFDPVTEVVLGPSYAGTNPATYTGTITIPATATPGATAMRVRCNYFSAPLATGACTAQTWGECEDYVVNIISSTPCSGTPTAGITTVNNPTPCPGVAVNFGLSGSSLVANLGYTWMRGNTINGPWTVLGAPSSSTYTVIPPQGVTRYYRCKVTCLTSGLFDTSAPVAVTPLLYSPTGPCWCTSQANFIADGEISNVTMGTLNNSTTCAAPLSGSQGTGTGLANQFANFTA
jgi:hypothetical protein